MIKAITDKILHILEDYGIRQYFNIKLINYLLVAFALVLGFHLNWDIMNVAIFAFAVWLILYPVQSQLLVKMALYLLLLTIALLVINKGATAEETIVLVYYFLFFSIIVTVIEYTNKNQKSKRLNDIKRAKHEIN